MITNLINDRGNAVKNQFVITGEENGKKIVTFQSYESRICDIVYNCGMGFDVLVRFGRDWNYSQTTAKHLYSFFETKRFGDFSKQAGNRGSYRKRSCKTG